ncbi:MAG: rod shape-determining protein MreC [Rickettsiales bacterium]|nr:rod shape-determining protein MreC [Rickettsiales bacterium]
MKQYINFNYSNISNYSLQHHFGQLFKRIELIFFIALSLVFLVTSKAHKNITDDVSFAFVGVSLPIVKFAAFPFNTIINLLINFQELIDAKKENISLKEENNKMRTLYVKAINVNNENQELKNLLQFIVPKSAHFVVAKISGRSHGLFNQNLFIDSGTNHDIAEGSIVTGAIGMIGRIVDITENKSRLMLVTDPSSRIPVIASKARARGVLIGTNNNLMEILYLSKHHQIKVNDMIFTSGDGDLLPPGILIGVVRKVDGSYVGVEMIEDINNADIVTVMKY